ncbi:ERO1-like protein alpha [Halichondria panicea]|uniref:ERO1-like protein alpha n=1 Tax=Halichondria panicea TaxID=6063 RepID=UPI00312B3468
MCSKGYLSVLLVALCWMGGTYTQQDPFGDLVKRKFYLERLDQCFCELTGQVAECCCDAETVESLNRDRIYPLVKSLVNHSFFKFFLVNLHRHCPFWPDDGRCVLRDCQVEECSEDEIPGYLKQTMQEFETNVPDVSSHVIESCDQVSDEEESLSTIDKTISIQQLEDFLIWQEHDETEDNFCQPEDETSSELRYVDLTLNPERYTGYSGHSAQRIWRAIYHENCFRPERVDQSTSIPLFHPSLLQGMCLEKRAFYRLVSGLHASINTHLSANYLLGKAEEDVQFGPNLNEFVRRFDVETTNGQGPGWLKNLYFAYLLVLKAVIKTEPYWQSYQFYTGNKTEDVETRNMVMEIIQAAKGCSSLFDESMMFTGNTSELLKNDFKAHFKNISRIMDCVGCDKCRLWGKLQVKGVGTALKILFSNRRNKAPLRLTRTEAIALFNVLGKFSSSIQYLEMFRRMEVNSNPSNDSISNKSEL